MSTYSEFKALMQVSSNDKTPVEDSEDSISLDNSIDEQKNKQFYKILLFRNYQSLIEDLPNIENILLQTGVENPKEFAVRVK